jgi:hypothetical protein
MMSLNFILFAGIALSIGIAATIHTIVHLVEPRTGLVTRTPQVHAE